MKKKGVTQSSLTRPPIVAVLGHVDHGKTTLLDYIRRSHLVEREHGGITQHIGAYQITNGNNTITFVDTPGHEAFAKMRSRGAGVADLALLVVAANDGVMSQTIESIKQINQAQIPLIVVANKIDLPEVNLDKLKSDLAKHNLQVESFGGKVPFVGVSAKTGAGVPQLLDLIMLVAQMQELPNEINKSATGVVIETRLDKGKGIVATIIVKKGTLKNGLVLYEGEKPIGKIRGMFDENNQVVLTAPPGKPVEVLGFNSIPQVGSIICDYSQASKLPESVPSTTTKKIISDFLSLEQTKPEQKLNILLKTDTAGSLEAIQGMLDKRVMIIGSAVGDINEADILRAKSSGAIAIGFNVKLSSGVEILAQTEKVVFRVYKIIYELLDELKEVAEGLKEVITKERELGRGEIIAEFPFDKERIAGVKVLMGRIARGDQVKILRNDQEIAKAKVKSLRQKKAEINKAEEKTECGVLFDRKVDFSLGDAIIAVTTG